MCGTHQKAMLYPSDFPMTTLPRWRIDCWPNNQGQISTALATPCFQAQAQTADRLCLTSILFGRQWHPIYALSASHSWRHTLYGTVSLCLTGRGLMLSLDQWITRHSRIKGAVCHLWDIRNCTPSTQFQPPGCFPLLKRVGTCRFLQVFAFRDAGRAAGTQL